MPFGLIMVLVSGAELFTGNTALVTAAYKEGKTSGKDLIKNWVSSYLGNFVGSLILAYLVHMSGTLGKLPGAVNLATAKANLSFAQAFSRGILCNWLVCMAVYMASGCSSMIGKMTAVWFPISAFVALVSYLLELNLCLRNTWIHFCVTCMIITHPSTNVTGVGSLGCQHVYHPLGYVAWG